MLFNVSHAQIRIHLAPSNPIHCQPQSIDQVTKVTLRAHGMYCETCACHICTLQRQVARSTPVTLYLPTEKSQSYIDGLAGSRYVAQYCGKCMNVRAVRRQQDMRRVQFLSQIVVIVCSVGNNMVGKYIYVVADVVRASTSCRVPSSNPERECA